MVTDNNLTNNNIFIRQAKNKIFSKFFCHYTLVSVALLLCQISTTPSAFAQAIETPGDGPYASPEIAGDKGSPPPVPSGSLSNWSGTNFSHVPEHIPLTIYLRTNTSSHTTHESVGTHSVLTIRPNTLNIMQLDLVSNVLNLNLSQAANTNTLWIDISEQQLIQLQSILAPSPNDSIARLDSQGRKKISEEAAVSKQQSYNLLSYLPTVRRFSAYAVLLGVVFATILFSLAAYALTMGERGSGQRIIGTAAGLIILLMAFTIYRLLISNAINSRSAPNITQVTQ